MIANNSALNQNNLFNTIILDSHFICLICMKTIKIKKANNFSGNSRVLVKYGLKKVHIKGFEFYAIPLESGDNIEASHLWTSSNILQYEDIIDGSIFTIKPRFGRLFTILVAVLFVLCCSIFFLYRSKWSFLPLGLVAIYISVYRIRPGKCIFDI